jgi:ribose transport system substrate-binding protein
MIPFIQTIPGSPYRIGHILAGAGGNVQPAAAAVKQINGKGNAIIIRGIPGIPYETDAYNGIKNVLSPCTDVKVVGEVNGGWTVPTVKTGVLNFLASHPEKIDTVLMVGDYAAGVIQAFEQVGRPVPVIAAGPANVGEIAWWGTKPDYCCIFGTAANSLQHMYFAWRVMTRVLGGKGLKVTDIAVDVPLITKANYKSYIVPGTTIDSVGEFPGADNAPNYAPDKYLDNFFVKKGNPFNVLK